MVENWINSGIILINDIIDDQRNISEVVILQNLICKQNWMSETSIVKKPIPVEWKQIIKNEESIMTGEYQLFKYPNIFKLTKLK